MKKSVISNIKFKSKAMKLLFLFVLILLCTLFYPAESHHLNSTDKQLEALFRKTFPHVTSVKWFNEGTFRKAVVEKDGMIIHLLYSDDGTLQRSSRFYLSEQLPPFILSRIYERYPTAEI
ncbi:MAG TPA: hypothetical protein VM012_07800, partial [Flavitalea sp.]|nr:hypothetical protein [Flavitalea sp.]